MRKLKMILAGLLMTLLTAPPVAAPQGWPNNFVYATLVDTYDVTTAAYTYVVFADRNAVVTTVPISGVLGPGTAVNFKAKTATLGTPSTTVTSNTAGQKPFQGLAVGDLLIFPRTNGVLGGDEEAVITTWTDEENIVVSDAVDLAGGFTFRFKKRLTTTGSALTGWWDVSAFDHFNIQADVNTINATSLDFTLECRTSKYAAPNTVYTKNFTAVGSDAISVSTHQEQCRVGWKITGDAGAQSVAAYFTGAK